MLFDSGHFALGENDPVAMVKRYVDRIKHVHLKDIRPDVVAKVKAEDMSFLAGVRAGAFTIPGDGCVDFDSIFKVLEEADYTGYMVVEAERILQRQIRWNMRFGQENLLQKKQDYKILSLRSRIKKWLENLLCRDGLYPVKTHYSGETNLKEMGTKNFLIVTDEVMIRLRKCSSCGTGAEKSEY